MKKILVLMMVMSIGLITACGTATTLSVVEEPEVEVETKKEEAKEQNGKKKEAVKEEIVEEISEEAEEETTAKEDELAVEEDKEADDLNIIREDFKAAMDEYEKFYDDYCDFMNKYVNSDPSDTLAMMNDYSNMLKQLNEMDEKFKSWESKDLTTAEMAYYLEVTTRIQKKLLELSNM